MRRHAVALLSSLILLGISSRVAGAQTYSEPTLGSGREVRGPRGVTVSCINVLRLRRVALLQDTSYLPPADIQKLVFGSLPAPKAPQSQQQSTQNVQLNGQSDEISSAFNDYRDEVVRLSARYDSQIGDVLRKIGNAKDLQNGLVGYIDDSFATAPPKEDCDSRALAIINTVNTPIPNVAYSDAISKVTNYLSTAWPDDAQINSNLAQVENRRKALHDLQDAPGWAAWYRGSRRIAYDDVLSLCTLLRERFTAALSSGDLYKDYAKQLVVLTDFSVRLSALKTDATHPPVDVAKSFSRTTDVNCDAHFGKAKQVAVKLVGTDDGIADKDKASFNREVVKVVCPPRVVASYGVGVNFQQERQYAVVQTKSDDPTATTAVKRFGTSTLSSERLLLAYLASVRWGHSPIFLTLGPTFSFESGIDPGLFYGLSYSFDDAAYLSAGWSIQRQTFLAGGFGAGDIVPTDVTTVPTRKSWQTGFTMLYTFPIGGANAGTAAQK